MKTHRNLILFGGISLSLITAFLLWPRPQNAAQALRLPAQNARALAVEASSVTPEVRPPVVAPIAAVAAEPAVGMEATARQAQPLPQPDLLKLDAFDGWISRWGQADAAGRAALAEDGAGLAAARRPEFKALIASNPRLALERSVPRVIRQDLPENIIAQLEKPVSAKGEYRVMHVCGYSADEHQASNPCDTKRSFVVGEVTYKANVEGALAGLMFRKTAPLQGVAIDDEMAISANAVRRLRAGERIPAGTVVEQLDPVSLATTADVSEGEVVTGEKPMVEIAGQLYSLSSPETVDVLEKDFIVWLENEYGGSTVPSFFVNNFPNPSAKWIGNRKILHVRVAWPDLPVTHTEESVIAASREVERLLNSWS
jgi:hypothetical protein